MALAEAQVAGACIVASPYQVPDQTLVPEATVGYDAGDATSLARALTTAKARDPARFVSRRASTSPTLLSEPAPRSSYSVTSQRHVIFRNDVW